MRYVNDPNNSYDISYNDEGTTVTIKYYSTPDCTGNTDQEMPFTHDKGDFDTCYEYTDGSTWSYMVMETESLPDDIAEARPMGP